jgi:transcription initiation factor TFIIB
MATRDIYERGFDESCGKQIRADVCPECSGDLVTDGGETSCTDCGLIVDTYRIDHAATPKSFPDSDPESSRERTGAPLTPTLHDRGLSTDIGWGRDGYGRQIDTSTRLRFNRLRRQHNRARWGSRANRNLGAGFGEVARITSALDLPETIEDEACELFRTAQSADLLRGRSIEAMAAASVYAVCRRSGVARALDEVTDVARERESLVGRSYRVLNVELDLAPGLILPRDKVQQLASACDATDEVRHRALELVGVAVDSGINNGRSPSGVAAACLYHAGREHGQRLVQGQLADAAGVSSSTIRARWNELRATLVESSDE